ncbi:uncharacterized protein LOC144100684 [Amblyomma americanum]
MTRVLQPSRLSPLSKVEDLPPGAIQISVIKNRRNSVIYPENIEPFKLFSLLVKGTVTSTNPLYHLDFVHDAQQYIRMQIHGSYFFASIRRMATEVTDDSRKEQRHLDFNAHKEWSIIFHVDRSINEIECLFNGQEVLREQNFPLSYFRIWEHFNMGVQVNELHVTSGIPHPAYYDRTDSTPFMKAFVRVEVGDDATIFGEHKDESGILVLNTSEKTNLSGCPAGEITIEVTRKSHGCTFSVLEHGKTVEVNRNALILHYDSFVPLFGDNFAIRNVTVVDKKA